LIPHRNSEDIDTDVADAIVLVSLCRQFQTLPREGGLLDQDSYHVWLMNIVLNAMHEKEEIERKKVK
jgi:hypothetical protein